MEVLKSDLCRIDVHMNAAAIQRCESSFPSLPFPPPNCVSNLTDLADRCFFLPSAGLKLQLTISVVRFSLILVRLQVCCVSLLITVVLEARACESTGIQSLDRLWADRFLNGLRRMSNGMLHRFSVVSYATGLVMAGGSVKCFFVRLCSLVW